MKVFKLRERTFLTIVLSNLVDLYSRMTQTFEETDTGNFGWCFLLFRAVFKFQ